MRILYLDNDPYNKIWFLKLKTREWLFKKDKWFKGHKPTSEYFDVIILEYK